MAKDQSLESPEFSGIGSFEPATSAQNRADVSPGFLHKHINNATNGQWRVGFLKLKCGCHSGVTNRCVLRYHPAMINIKLNGEERSIMANWSITELLDDLKINNRYCAVEQNQQLIPREQHANCKLQAGDRIEIVTLVGGG